MLLLSHFSRVRLCATPQTAAHQPPLTLGFSRQEHWSGLPFPSPMHESESESEVAQSRPTVSYPMDFSLPGSSVHGIFQARVLEWGATAFSTCCAYKEAMEDSRLQIRSTELHYSQQSSHVSVTFVSCSFAPRSYEDDETQSR